ncbi:MAG: NAD(P)H-hydrate dehydratase [Actinobacteria bacterium]|nr:NAD(P)H-hydrate dehydratase [Actinomycetota bacterium]
MIPVLTPAEMAQVDRSAPEPFDVLVRRAAGAVVRAATGLLGGIYGRRVVVVAGPGHNGDDGRLAAQLLAQRGVRTTVFAADACPDVLPSSDLVIDAAYGTGFHGTFDFPDPNGAPVLAVDIPSGVDGLTGAVSGRPAHAVATVTFAALKPGLVLGDGPTYCGEVVLADIGLDVSCASAFLVSDADVRAWVPERRGDDHKWRHAVWVIGGSPGMLGAPTMATVAAFRAGAGYVRLSVPGEPHVDAPLESVVVPLPVRDFDEPILADVRRFRALAVGPGLGRSTDTDASLRRLLAGADLPVVVDGDALWLLGRDAPGILSARSAPTVLTPHDAEFERLAGSPPGADRMAAARALAASTGAVVLLKGPTTTIAGPDGTCLLVRSGDARLATAGTGDVLTGVVAAFLACGAEPTFAAAAAAHLHGRAALRCPERGTVAADVAAALPDAWAHLA